MTGTRSEGRFPGRWARRDVLKLGVAAGLGGGLPQEGRAGSLRTLQTLQGLRTSGRRSGATRLDPAIVIDGIDVHALAMRALDAATAAGATYADVRLTRLLTQSLDAVGYAHAGSFGEDERLGLGVRVRVGGAWGFAASPYWEAEEAVQLAREAVTEARANARETLATPEWTPIPVASGHWATPIQVDPFVLSPEEKIDYLATCEMLAGRYRGTVGEWRLLGWTREEQAVATSDGSYVTQTLYTTGGVYSVWRRSLIKHAGEDLQGNATAAGVWPGIAAGWEVFTEADIPGQIPALYDAASPRRHPAPPVKPGEVGRYDVVFSGGAMASLLARTLGVATQLDRALGHEANAGGTSYLGPDPLALLGSFQAASPLVTVTANRSMRRGLATVKWDAEAVEPEDCTLIKDGILVDYQTTRAQAPLLAPYYQKAGRSVRSHGCAAAQDATFVTTQLVPNLVLEPAREGVDVQDLLADTKRGFAVLGGQIATDFQARTGSGEQLGMREIVNGQLGAYVTGLDFLFTSPIFWKNIVALGGAQSAGQYTGSHQKGQPEQGRSFSVRAVPAKVKDVDFVNPLRRA